MKNIIVSILLIITFLLSLCSCSQQKQAVIKEEDIHAICELATLKCYYNNVAQIEKEKENIFQKDRKMWIEYEGVATIGVDMSQVKVKTSGNTITINMPEAELMSLGLNTDTFGEKEIISSHKGWFGISINTEEQNQAMILGDEEMEKAIKENKALFVKAQDRAKELIKCYIDKIGSAAGVDYEIKWEN